MRTIALVLVGLSLLSGGCATAVVDHTPLQQVVVAYLSVKSGMTQEEIMAQLGAPDGAEKNGVFHWSQHPGDGRYAELSVNFDAAGRAMNPSVRWSFRPPPPNPADYPTIPDSLVNPPEPPGTPHYGGAP